MVVLCLGARGNSPFQGVFLAVAVAAPEASNATDADIVREVRTHLEEFSDGSASGYSRFGRWGQRTSQSLEDIQTRCRWIGGEDLNTPGIGPKEPCDLVNS
jgi:hypothetical protein